MPAGGEELGKIAVKSSPNVTRSNGIMVDHPKLRVIVWTKSCRQLIKTIMRDRDELKLILNIHCS